MKPADTEFGGLNRLPIKCPMRQVAPSGRTFPAGFCTRQTNWPARTRQAIARKAGLSPLWPEQVQTPIGQHRNTNSIFWAQKSATNQNLWKQCFQARLIFLSTVSFAIFNHVLFGFMVLVGFPLAQYPG